MSTKNTDSNLVNLLTSHQLVMGDFEIPKGSEELMDRDWNGATFKDANITGGDYCSTTFKECKFENVVFKNAAMVGVSFKGCTFINCKMINVQIDMSIQNSDVVGLLFTYKT